MCLLRLIYPTDESVKYYLGSVLSAVGNYRGLKSSAVEDYRSADVLDGLFYEFDKENHLIPGKENEYFFHDQKNVFDGLSHQFFSYSGPTSMGKSFVVQTYIKQQINTGSTKNFAILVPTKALINEVRSNIFESLQNQLDARNYKVVSAIGEIYLQQDHHFIFIMTPERLHHLLIENFLATLLRSPAVFNTLTSLSSGGTAKGVSQKSLAGVDVRIPVDLREQTLLATYFHNLDRLITLHQRKCDEL